MIGATILLTAVYWLSDLAVAMWMGGLLVVGLLIGLPLDLPQGADPILVANGASTAVEMILRPRSYIIGAAFILFASVVLGVILERRARRSFAWWVIWLLRSVSGVCMFGVAVYSFGNLDSYINTIQDSSDTLKKSLTVQESAQSATQMPDVDIARMMQNPYAAATVATVRTDFGNLQKRYEYWMWIQLLLGSVVLFAGALKQAAWRRSWGKDGEHPAAGAEPPTAKPAEPSGEQTTAPSSPEPPTKFRTSP